MTLKIYSFVKKSFKKKKRLGRGNSSGLGGECGRGHKGQKSRSGYKRRFGFEGGQMPLYRRLPKKRGFFNQFSAKVYIVNFNDINQFYEDGETVSPITLFEKGLLPENCKYKILAKGDIDKNIIISSYSFSKSAIDYLEKNSIQHNLLN